MKRGAILYNILGATLMGALGTGPLAAFAGVTIVGTDRDEQRGTDLFETQGGTFLKFGNSLPNADGAVIPAGALGAFQGKPSDTIPGDRWPEPPNPPDVQLSGFTTQVECKIQFKPVWKDPHGNTVGPDHQHVTKQASKTPDGVRCNIDTAVQRTNTERFENDGDVKDFDLLMSQLDLVGAIPVHFGTTSQPAMYNVRVQLVDPQVPGRMRLKAIPTDRTELPPSSPGVDPHNRFVQGTMRLGSRGDSVDAAFPTKINAGAPNFPSFFEDNPDALGLPLHYQVRLDLADNEENTPFWNNTCGSPGAPPSPNCVQPFFVSDPMWSVLHSTNVSEPTATFVHVSLDGDTDGNGFVDNTDLGVALGNFDEDRTDLFFDDGDNDGNGNVDNTDLGAALGEFTGPDPVSVPALASPRIAAAHLGTDGSKADLIYNWTNGSVVLDATDASGGIVINFVLKNAVGGEDFNAPSTADFPYKVFDGDTMVWEVNSFATDRTTEISQTDGTAAGFRDANGKKVTKYNLGNIFPTGMNGQALESFLTKRTYVGQKGSGTQNLELTVVPEPSGVALIAIGAMALAGWQRVRRRSVHPQCAG